jgi:hypothetical protein
MAKPEDTVFDIVVRPIKYHTNHFGKNRGRKTPVKWGYWIYNAQNEKIGFGPFLSPRGCYSEEEARREATEHCAEILACGFPVEQALRHHVPTFSVTGAELIAMGA